MPCLVLSFRYIPKAAYYFSKNSGAFRQHEPKKYKEWLATANIYNQSHKNPCFQQPRTQGSLAMNILVCRNSTMDCR